MAARNRLPEGEVDYRKPAQPTSHDFLTDMKWIIFVSGFSEIANPIYTIYRGFIFTTFIYMMMMCVTACCMQPEKEVIVSASQSILLDIFGIWVLSTRLITQSSIHKTRSMIRSGVYRYEDEEEDEELMKMKKGIPKEIYARFNIFLVIYISGAFTNGVVLPLSQIILLEQDFSQESQVVNPYFPQLFYQPLDMRTRLGFLYGFLFGIVYFSILYSLGLAANWVYISYTVQMKVHFQVLNYSIKNIQKRASLICSKNFGRHLLDLPTAKEFFQTKEFEGCLYNCLRSNIQHHQALLRFMKAFRPFYGSYILDLFTVASSLCGAQLYLLNLVPPINILIPLVLTFIAEQITTFYFCMLGENIISESQEVFTSLYRISWFNYNRRFNHTLQTMMANTLKPMGLKAHLLRVIASLEIYGSIMTAMYQLCNLVRQSDAE